MKKYEKQFAFAVQCSQDRSCAMCFVVSIDVPALYQMHSTIYSHFTHFI